MRPKRNQLNGPKARKSQSSVGIIALLSISVVILLGLMLTPLPEKIRSTLGLVKKIPKEIVEPKVVIRVVEKIVERPAVVENGDRERNHRLQKDTDLLKLSNGINFHPELILEDGDLATRERVKSDSYEANYTLKVKVPKAATSLAELSETNANLPKMLPALPALLESAKVSPFYKNLYANKTGRLKNSLYQLDDLLSGHNFFDCETMLEITAKPSGRKVFLMQGDMDVVSDGSDGDRLATMPDEVVNSSYYQPYTSYGWKKTSATPNPMIAGFKKRIENAKAEIALAATTAARKKWLRDRMAELQRGIADMERRSFLIAEYDPFIVIPVNMLLDRKSAFVPNVGDYAVVIYKNQLYPSIVGDGGPTFKVGEGSLRLARQLDPKAGPYRRPVSTLEVTYLVFPRSAPATRVAPDYEKWKSECTRLLEEIGGLGEGYSLYTWEDKLKKPEPVNPVEPTTPTPDAVVPATTQ